MRWHDGKPLTARDVLFTEELIRRQDDGKRHALVFGPLDRVTAEDDLTVTAIYKEPFSGALTGWRETLIQPAHIPRDPNSPVLRAPVGTGPFSFVRWEPQQRIVLDANRDYFGGRPFLDRYEQRIIPSAESLRAAAEAGEVDVAPLGVDWLRAREGKPDGALPFSAQIIPTRVMQMIYWNVDGAGGLFRDARVRRAMTLLLDRQAYVSRIQRGVYRVPATLVDVWEGDPALAPLPCDPAAAAKLLDEAGITDRDGDGVRDGPGGPAAFTLLYPATAPDHREIAQLMERAAAAVGVRVTLQGLEWAVMRPRVYARSFDAAVFQWALEPLPDPFAYFHSSQIQPGSGTNFGGYRSAPFDKLAERARQTSDPAAQSDLLRAMQAILHEDQPCTFVAIAGSVMAIARRFHHPDITAAGLWNWYPGLLVWWVPPDERKHR